MSFLTKSRVTVVSLTLVWWGAALGIRGLSRMPAPNHSPRETPSEARRRVQELLEQGLSLRAGGRPAEASFRDALELARSVELSWNDSSYVRVTERYASVNAEEARALVEATYDIAQAEKDYQNARYTKAHRQGRNALETFRDREDPWGELRALHLLGNIAMVRRETEEAVRAYRELAELASAHSHPLREASAVNNLAALDERAGQLQDAVEGYHRARRLAEQHGLPKIRAFALLYLGTLYHRLGMWEDAVAYLRRAKEGFREIGEIRLEGIAASNLGASLQRGGRLDEAIESYRLALSLRARTEDSQGRLATLLHVSELYAEKKNTRDALRILNQILSKSSGRVAGELGYLRWGALIAAADIHLSEGRKARARALYQDASEIVAALGAPLDRVAMARRWARIAVSESRFQEAIAQLTEAVGLIEALRSSPEGERERIRLLQAQQSVFQELGELYLSSAGDPEGAFLFFERARARALLDLMEVGAHLGFPGEEQAVRLSGAAEPISLRDVLERLRPEELLLQYTVAEDGWIVIAVDRSGVRVARRFAADVRELARDIEQFVQACRDATESAETMGSRLGRQLLEPVGEILAETRRVIVIPDAALADVPWAALPWAEGLLVAKHDISVQPSASVWARLRDRPRRTEALRPLVVASAGGGNERRRGLGVLMEVEEEARFIASRFPSSRVLLGRALDERAVASAVPGHSVIHFATHASVSASRPLASALLLTPSPSPWAAEGFASAVATDGVLTGYEVLGLRLERGALVTLAACDTLGADGQARGLFGLARAFFHAGAGAVMGSLWPVDDRATRELMVRFYRELANSGTSASEALGAAQRELLEGAAGERWRHPSHWAAFVLVGDGG